MAMQLERDIPTEAPRDAPCCAAPVLRHSPDSVGGRVGISPLHQLPCVIQDNSDIILQAHPCSNNHDRKATAQGESATPQLKGSLAVGSCFWWWAVLWQSRRNVRFSCSCHDLAEQFLTIRGIPSLYMLCSVAQPQQSSALFHDPRIDTLTV